MSRGAVFDAALIESHPQCLQSVISRRNRKGIDLLLSYLPDLTRVPGLVTKALRSWCNSPADALTIVRSLLDCGASDLRGPPPLPRQRPQSFSEAVVTTPEPVTMAIRQGSVDLLRLFDEFKFDWSTISPYPSPVAEAIAVFLTEKGVKCHALDLRGPKSPQQ
jgi:hypothetical protein